MTVCNNWEMLWEWPGFLIFESNQYSLKKAVEILLVAGAVTGLKVLTEKCCQLFLIKQIVTEWFRFLQANHIFWLTWKCCHLIDLVWGFFFLPGGAPNYYPNSFTGPEDQPQLKESRMFASGDVQRFNSADEDNVTQVRVWKGLLLLSTHQEG